MNSEKFPFLPISREDMQKLGWDELDVILVTGDTYIDSPFVGVAVIGKVLVAAGYRVGIIAQPDVHAGEDIMRLGEPLPAHFGGVTTQTPNSLSPTESHNAGGPVDGRIAYAQGGTGDSLIGRHDRRPGDAGHGIARRASRCG